MHRAFELGQEMAAYETIYFSDQRVFQHYRIDHPKNRGELNIKALTHEFSIQR
jgi:dTDP-glucose pyrophosphorylase